MNRKIRNRNTKDSAQLFLMKMLPLLFMLLLFLVSSTIGIASSGPLRPGVD